MDNISCNYDIRVKELNVFHGVLGIQAIDTPAPTRSYQTLFYFCRYFTYLMLSIYLSN